MTMDLVLHIIDFLQKTEEAKCKLLVSESVLRNNSSAALNSP